MTASLRIKKAVGLTAAVILVGAWFYLGGRETKYISYPRSPDPASQRTVPFPVKGVVVYITQQERASYSLVEWIMFGCGMVVGAVFLIHGGDPFKSKKA